MADIKQDLLALEYSPSFFMEGIQEADINLKLPPAPVGLATVSGVVTDGTVPLANATVKLFDKDGVPFRHTLTDEEGRYSLSGVPVGTYTISAAMVGYRMSGGMGLTLAANDVLQADLTCVPDDSLKLGTIAGVLTTMGPEGRVPLAGAKLTLRDSQDQVVATTYTADDGEFLFYDVTDGVYTMVSTADGYLPSAPVLVNVTGGSIANVTMDMAVDSRTYNGTVSGIIRDKNGGVVAGCFVGLYQRTGQGAEASETLVAITKTNSEGKYLFGGVTGGQYLVKAKLNR